MKTQRRHELQTNVLADWLGHYVEQLRPYTKHFVLVLVAIAVVVAVSGFLLNDQSSRLSAGWSDYFAASNDANPDPARLRAVAEQHEGTVAGLWAQLTEADTELARGMRLLYTDRESANNALDRAVSSYETVVEGLADQPELQASARFGLAQAFECSGRISKAIEAYAEVAASGDPDSGLVAQAIARKEQLEDPDVKRFYNWFAQQQPVPPTPPGALPAIGSPPELPDNLGLLPDEPDFTFPPVDQGPGDVPAPTVEGSATTDSLTETPDSDDSIESQEEVSDE